MAQQSPGYGQRSRVTVRLRPGIYQAPLAHRQMDREWPETIQRLWYSCHNAEATYRELEEAALHDRMNALRLSQLTQFAWQCWHDIEDYAAPIVAAVEASQR